MLAFLVFAGPAVPPSSRAANRASSIRGARRSAQEGLTNIRKHAGATAAELTLDFTAATRVTLTVADNGRGANGAAASGFGLVGIRERIEILGGRVQSANRPGGGYILTVEVPA